MKSIEKAKRGFMLVELLVVISIIALLLAILLPSLNKARELANRIVCGQNLKTLGIASTAYASIYNGYYVPLSFYAYGPGLSNGGPSASVANNGEQSGMHYRWVNNSAFTSFIQKDELAVGDGSAFEEDYSMPKELMCPSDKISKDPANAGEGGVLLSYAYNGTEWGRFRIGESEDERQSFCGYKADLLKSPADKLQFTDSVGWWCNWRGADYRIGWDVFKQANLRVYKNAYKDKTGGIHGPVVYRHNEGANVGFYDGHVEYLKKTVIFVAEDYDAPTTPKWAGMWTASGWLTTTD